MKPQYCKEHHIKEFCHCDIREAQHKGFKDAMDSCMFSIKEIERLAVERYKLSLNKDQPL